MITNLKRIGPVTLVILMLIALLPFAATAQEGETERTGIRPDAPPYGVRGPYAVGTMDFVIEDEERPLNITVWYPALNPDGLEEVGTYEVYLGQAFPTMTLEGSAIRDAAPDYDSGPYPLVVDSHGYGYYRTGTLWNTEHVASHGFVVIAPDHLGNYLPEFLDAMFDPTLMEAYHSTRVLSNVTRPLDVGRVIDFAAEMTAESGELEGLVDVETVAVTGWSFGGYTTWAAAGARLDFDAREAYCEANQLEGPHGMDGGPGDCHLRDFDEQLAAAAGLDEVPDGLWPSLGDSRVDAIVSFAGSNAYVFGEEGLAAVEIPAMMIVGGGDLPGAEHGTYYAYDHLGSQDKSLVVLEYGWHGLFGDKCTPVLLQLGFFAYCSDQVWDMDRAHDLINHFTTAFLMSVLYEDAEAAAALAPDAVAFPGIRYETTQ